MTPGIYIHLPFCVVHCSYCDFPLSTRLSLSDSYYEALRKEVQIRTPLVSDTLYFGGGTPSQTPIPIIKEFVNSVPLEANAEITLEANPDDISAVSLMGWMDSGINRLSIGIQSLETPALKTMLRHHSAQQSLVALENAKRVGFPNVSVDLILGSPDQTSHGFLFGLSQLLDFRPQHFSIYMLEVHEGTYLADQIQRGKKRAMSEDDQVDCYFQAVSMLKESGYGHYEVSNFALAGFESRHNLKYWTNAPYYGYGIGACSYYSGRRIQNVREIPEYVRMLSAAQPPIDSEILEDPETEARNALIFGLRKTAGIEVENFQQLYGIHPLTLFENQGQVYLTEGFLELNEGHLRLTFQGLVLSNEILSSAI